MPHVCSTASLNSASHSLPREELLFAEPDEKAFVLKLFNDVLGDLKIGQHTDYLVLQLELFKKGDRGGSPYAHLMRPVAARLKPEQMRDVAPYFESLRPPQPQAAGPNSA